MNDNYVGYRIKLYPTEEQIDTFEKYFGACRFVYNLGIDLEEEYYEASKNDDSTKYKTLSHYGLINKLTSLKKEDKYYWLNDFDTGSLRLVLKDVEIAFKRFFNKISKYPKYKSKKNYHQMFPVRSERLKVYESSIYLPSIGEIQTGINKQELIGAGNKDKKNSIYKHYCNARVVYDGYSYWLTFTLEKNHEQGIECNSCKRFINNEVWNHKPYSDDVGIDLGCGRSKWIVDSQGTRIVRPDTSKSEAKIKKLQRKLACKRRVNDKKFEEELLQQGEITNPTLVKARRRYSNNELKILKKMNKEYKHITNVKKNAIHEYACNLIETKPRSVTMETLSVEDMLLKNKDIPRKHRDRHNKMVYESMLYTVIDIIDTKCTNNNIPVIYANDDYPSTQLCSRCGNRYHVGKSNIYHCPSCGLDIDRDYNASLNLRDFQYSSYCNTNSIAV